MSRARTLDITKVRELGTRWLKRFRTGEAYRRVWESAEGRLVLEDILRVAGLIDSSFVGGSQDHTAFNEGKRAVGLHVLRAVNGGLIELTALEVDRAAQAADDA